MDFANGRRICGCDSIAYCKVGDLRVTPSSLIPHQQQLETNATELFLIPQANATFGSCEVPNANAASPGPAAPPVETGAAPPAGRLLDWRWSLVVLLVVSAFLSDASGAAY